jgi:hypothetical protein
VGMRLLFAGFGVCLVADDFALRLGVCFSRLFTLAILGFCCFAATSLPPIKSDEDKTYLPCSVVPPPPLFNSRSKKRLFSKLDLVVSPQPTCNPNPTQNYKRLFLQGLIEDEVVGVASLLLLI